MEKEFAIDKNSNSTPTYAPIYHGPNIPRETKNTRYVYSICRGEEKIIRKYLSATPFEYVNDIYRVGFSDCPNNTSLCHPEEPRPYTGCSLTFNIKYKGQMYAFYMFNYVNHDYTVAAGREIWGYPKKLAEVTLSKTGTIIKGTCVRYGKTIVEIEMDLSKPLRNVPTFKTDPHLTHYVIPKPDGPGIFSERVILMDASSSVTKMISEQYGETKVRLDGLTWDPLHELKPKEVMGGGFVVCDVLFTEEKGWGKVIETII
jgi:acetoacetate decarboxylase